jgi:hypothetical protein
MLFRWRLATILVLFLLYWPSTNGLVSPFHADVSSGAVMGDKSGRQSDLLQLVLNVTSTNQTQSTTTEEPPNASGFPQMPLPPVSEPQSQSSNMNYVQVTGIAAAVGLAAMLLFLRFRRKKRENPAKDKSTSGESIVDGQVTHE